MTPYIMCDILIFKTSVVFRKLGEGNFISVRGSDGLDPTLPHCIKKLFLCWFILCFQKISALLLSKK